MQLLLNSLRVLLLIATIAMAGVWTLVGWDVHQQFPHVQQILTDSNRTVIEAGAAVGNFEKATRSWKDASDAQARNLTLVTSKAGQDLDALKDAIVKVGNSADTLNTQLVMLGEQTTEATNQFQVTLLGVGPVVDNLKDAAANLSKLTGDANLSASLRNIELSTAQLASTSENIAGISKDARDVADKVRNDYLKPQRLAWVLVKELLPYAYYLKSLI